MNELGWAQVDLEHALTLYENAQETGRSADETWESQGHVWHLRAWQDKHRTGRGEVLAGLWNATLTEDGTTGHWTFVKSATGWSASHHRMTS